MGPEVGAALLDARPDACVFTGSTASGRRVSVRCAQLGIPCSAEMGGKDPAIVLADCDLERTVAGITHWALCNAGQACGAIEVVYVERAVADRFVAKMRAGVDPAACRAGARGFHRRRHRWPTSASSSW